MTLMSLSLICMVGYMSPSLINRLHVLQCLALRMKMITHVLVCRNGAKTAAKPER